MEYIERNYKNKIVYRNSIFSTVYKFASAGLSFVSAPLLLNCLGEEKYGAWATLLSLISWVYYFDLGIGNGLRNKLAASFAINDLESSKGYIATSYVLISGITLFIFLIAFIIVSVVEVESLLGLIINGEKVRTCLIVAVGFACVNFVMSLANNILYATQHASLVNLFSCVAQIIFVLLLLVYLATGVDTVLLIAAGEGCSQLTKNVIETIYVFKKYKYLHFNFHDYSRKYCKGILSFGIQMFIVQIAALVLNSTDNLIITKLFGSMSVTPYNFCYKYFNMIQTVYVALITPLLSAYTAAYALRDIKWIKQAMKKNALLYVLFFAGTIIAAFIFKPFSLMWLQKDLAYNTSLIVYTVLYFILLMFNHIFSTFLSGIGRIRETTIATVISTIINIPASVFFARNLCMGTSGVMLGSVFSLIFGALVAPIITFKELRRLDGGR